MSSRRGPVHSEVLYFSQTKRWIKGRNNATYLLLMHRARSDPVQCGLTLFYLKQVSATQGPRLHPKLMNTVIGHFISYTLLVTYFRAALILHGTDFIKVLEMFLRDFGSYSHDSITVAVASVSSSQLSGVAPGGTFCCCSPFASRFDVFCIQRCSSAYFGCNMQLFESLFPSYQLEAV